MAKKKPVQDFEFDDNLSADDNPGTEVREVDSDELEDGFANFTDEDDNGIISEEEIKNKVRRDPNDATQGRTPGVPDITSDEVNAFDQKEKTQRALEASPDSPFPLGRKHVGALRSDPTRMDSSTPQEEKDEIEPGTIIEKRNDKFNAGFVVRKKISGDTEDR